MREGGKTLIKRDLSGKPVSVNRKLLELLLENDFTPVITVPIIDERNAAINSENDDVVTLLAHALRPNWVIQLIEAPGVLRDPDDPASVIPAITPEEVARWEDRKSSRMTRKMKAICRIARSGVTRVVIADGRAESPIASAMAGHGTVVA